MTGPVSGYGQAQPSDGAHPYNAAKFIFDQLNRKNVTSRIVQVVAVYNAGGGTVDGNGTGVVGLTGTVDVVPLVNAMDGVGNTQPHGTVHGIPFGRTQGGTNAVICDPQVGDIGIMVCADRDISSVKANRAASNPGSQRAFDLADGMYVCSLLNTADPDQYVRFTATGIIVVDKNGNTFTTSPQGITLTDCNGNTVKMTAAGMTFTDCNGNTIEMKSGSVVVTTDLFKVDGNAEFTGTVTGDTSGSAVGLTTHTHNQPNDSHGDTEEPTDPPNPGT